MVGPQGIDSNQEHIGWLNFCLLPFPMSCPGKGAGEVEKEENENHENKFIFNFSYIQLHCVFSFSSML
jgi:hypothetical protein